MTLGEFRKETEKLPDDYELNRIITSDYGPTHVEVVTVDHNNKTILVD